MNDLGSFEAEGQKRNDQKPRISEQEAAEVFGLAARLHAEKNSGYSPEELMQAGVEAGIPPELVQQAIKKLHARSSQQQAHPPRRIRSTFSESLIAGVSRFFSRKKVSLSKKNLRGSNLEAANLRNRDLSGFFLQGANLRDADLSDANLRGANLKGANLESANLQGVDLSEAILLGANLENANLDGAILTDTILTGANIRGAVLSNRKQSFVY